MFRFSLFLLLIKKRKLKSIVSSFRVDFQLYFKRIRIFNYKNLSNSIDLFYIDGANIYFFTQRQINLQPVPKCLWPYPHITSANIDYQREANFS